MTGTLSVIFRRGRPEAAGKPARSAQVRANGGWFGPARRAPRLPRDESMLPDDDFTALEAAFTATGFRGPGAWYVNDDANLAYAATAPDGGRLRMPVLFVHAAWDSICETVRSPLAGPMRAACTDLTEITIAAGHDVPLERPAELSAALQAWLAR